MKTLIELLAAGNAQSTCLSAANSAPLSYSALRQLSQYVQTAFNQVGIGRNDRVALVLPNSAEMAASFVTVACCCTSAPLNPSYRADEFEFYLNDLNAKALVVCSSLCFNAFAQANWEPSKSVEFIVPAGTGGGADLTPVSMLALVEFYSHCLAT